MINAIIKRTNPNTHRKEKTKVGWSVLTNLTVFTKHGWAYNSEPDND